MNDPSVMARLREFDERMAEVRGQLAKHHDGERPAKSDPPNPTNQFGLLIDELRAYQGRQLAKAKAADAWVEDFWRARRERKPAADSGPILKSVQAMNRELAADLRERRQAQFRQKFAEANENLTRVVAAGKVGAVDAARAEARLARMAARARIA